MAEIGRLTLAIRKTREFAIRVGSCRTKGHQNVFNWSLAAITFFTFSMWIAFSPVTFAQNAASVNGTVKDVSGAVVPGASLVLKNVDTGVEHTTVTNAAGVYAFQAILPGKYTIGVRKIGFTTAEQQGITLVVGQTATYDFSLSPGSTTETVTVQATAAALQTSTAELGTLVSKQEVNDLPLNGRNFSQLLQLTPGASPANPSQNSSGWRTNAFGSFVFPAINGQTNRSNMYLLDGLNNQESLSGTFLITPILDDIQEFKVESHNDQPQYGQVLGGIVNVQTKSGTNDFHGTAWEYLRNDFFNARNPFVTKVPPLRQNQFGANIGGPVRLPFYNGRNKTFFFGSYQGLRQHISNGQVGYFVPTPTQLSGDFSADLANGVNIYDPFSTRPDPANPGFYIRDPFPGDIIPSNRIDPNALTYAKLNFPPALAPYGVNHYNGLDKTPFTHLIDEYNLRGDEQLGNSDSFWFRFSHTNGPETQSGGTTLLESIGPFKAYQVAASWQHTFGPTTVLQVRFARDRGTVGSNIQLKGNAEQTARQIISQANISPAFACNFAGPRNCLDPGMSIPGYAPTGENLGYPNANSDIYQWKADLSKVMGKHIFSMGGEFNTNNISEAVAVTASATFSTFETQCLDKVCPGTSPGGDALASFLLGVPDGAQRRNVDETAYGGWVDGFYFTDQWKVTDRFTANLGVRYDFTLWPVFGSDKGLVNRVGDFDLSNGTYILEKNAPPCGVAPCIPGGVLPPHVVVSPNGKIVHNTFDNIQPRVGLAYRLSSKLALHASYGRFFDNWAGITQLAQDWAGSWPNVGGANNAANLNPTVPTKFLENPFAGSLGPIPPPTPFDPSNVTWYTDPHIKNPYSDQWAFGTQYQLTSDTVLNAHYVGSHGSRLDIGGFNNVATTPGPGDPALRRPYPYIPSIFYDHSVGRSSYNAFQFTANKRASHGLSYLVSYTWGKSIDLACSGIVGTEGCSIENPYDYKRDRGPSAFDLTHVVTVSTVYEFPVGSGRRFSTGSRAADYLLGNWKLNGIFTYTSGNVYDVGVGGDIANTGMFGCCNGYYERMNLVGDPYSVTIRPQHGFNTAAFAVPAPYTFGDLGRDALRGDPYKNLDVSVFREFPITERRKFEFRAEAFNVTNTPTWGLPDVNFSDGQNFGRIFSTRSTERQLQFAMKFYF